MDDAAAETSDLNKRYEKYAKAQAWVSDSSLLIPVASSGGSPTVSRTVPFTKAYSQVGIKGDPFVFKGLELQNDVVTAKEYEEAFKKWQQEKNETNAKYQKELEKHVKESRNRKGSCRKLCFLFCFETPVVIKAVTLHF